MKPPSNQLVPRKRTALDGKSWWCVWDTNLGDWTHDIRLAAKYKTKKSCEAAIAFIHK